MFWRVFDRIILTAGAVSGIVAAYYARVAYLDGRRDATSIGSSDTLLMAPNLYVWMYGLGSLAMLIIGVVGLFRRGANPLQALRFEKTDPTHKNANPETADRTDIRRQHTATNAALTIDPTGRTLLSITPKELMQLYESHTDIQGDKLSEAYLGHWIKIEGTVLNVLPGVTPAVMKVQLSNSVILDFSAKWPSMVATLRKGETISALGKLQRVTRYWISLKECEFLE